jgi:hypothetical protein
MSRPLGIGKLDRERMTAMLRSTQHTISVAETPNSMRKCNHSLIEFGHGTIREGYKILITPLSAPRIDSQAAGSFKLK